VRGDLRPHRSRSQNRSFFNSHKVVWCDRHFAAPLGSLKTPLNWPSKGL
jgi:hypothetical protein